MLALDHHALDWPAPIDILNADSDAEIVLICDHASNHIPAEYDGLGVGSADLKRHIAWDVGAAGVTRGLAARLGAPAFLGTYSRLLVDLNRPFGSATSMTVVSEATSIPGNRDLPQAEIERRRRLIFDPFHDALAAFLDRRAVASKRSRIVAIHSFTPVFLGVARPWHVGILHDDAHAYASRVMTALSRDPALLVGENVPYQIDRDGDYAIPVHGTDRGHPALLIEIRNDLISDAAGIREWTDRLAAVL
ncbi:N-formylglutamate amidohydrolase [Aquibium carbonis]|uniref:N-formylglutamate amidohydrolase n=1 Tax=Aquibium carbonis TaxID=2495581 RepID=A0A429Z253_9HYPH|nr:N-formylglutamate amidohydrolase [Aquibium carbonis]RST87786.1 N-formylglutamate amidohydrolase [Aquibium carbonis]